MRKKMADGGGHFLCNVFKMSENGAIRLKFTSKRLQNEINCLYLQR